MGEGRGGDKRTDGIVRGGVNGEGTYIWEGVVCVEVLGRVNRAL